jgi:hypothetical protein
VSLFKEKIKEDGHYEETDTDHFENIQSTNWQTMRFKPPPPGDTIGRSTRSSDNPESLNPGFGSGLFGESEFLSRFSMTRYLNSLLVKKIWPLTVSLIAICFVTLQYL